MASLQCISAAFKLAERFAESFCCYCTAEDTSASSEGSEERRLRKQQPSLAVNAKGKREKLYTFCQAQLNRMQFAYTQIYNAPDRATVMSPTAPQSLVRQSCFSYLREDATDTLDANAHKGWELLLQ